MTNVFPIVANKINWKHEHNVTLINAMLAEFSVKSVADWFGITTNVLMGYSHRNQIRILPTKEYTKPASALDLWAQRHVELAPFALIDFYGNVCGIEHKFDNQYVSTPDVKPEPKITKVLAPRKSRAKLKPEAVQVPEELRGATKHAAILDVAGFSSVGAQRGVLIDKRLDASAEDSTEVEFVEPVFEQPVEEKPLTELLEKDINWSNNASIQPASEGVIIPDTTPSDPVEIITESPPCQLISSPISDVEAKVHILEADDFEEDQVEDVAPKRKNTAFIEHALTTDDDKSVLSERMQKDYPNARPIFSRGKFCTYPLWDLKWSNEQDKYTADFASYEEHRFVCGNPLDTNSAYISDNVQAPYCSNCLEKTSAPRRGRSDSLPRHLYRS